MSLRPAPPSLLLVLLLVSAALGAGPARAATDPAGVWPLRPTPRVVGWFDPPESPWGTGHRGVDLAGSVGQLVVAALDGQVRYAGVLAGRGVVVVGHGTTRTTYEPVEALVRVGELVSAGDPLAALQLAGSHCLPLACLHWGWLRADTYLDPLELVGAGPVRLLPLWQPAPATRWPVLPRWWRPLAQALGCACW